MLNVIGTVIFGAVIGLLARLFVHDRKKVSRLWTVICGVIGVLAGNAVLGALNPGLLHTRGINWIQWIVCTALAAAAISVYLKLKTSR